MRACVRACVRACTLLAQPMCVCVYVEVAEMLLELCVTELEDVAADKQAVCGVAQPVVQESPHPYTDDMTLTGTTHIPGTYICSALSYIPATANAFHSVVLICLLYALYVHCVPKNVHLFIF